MYVYTHIWSFININFSHSLLLLPLFPSVNTLPQAGWQVLRILPRPLPLLPYPDSYWREWCLTEPHTQLKFSIGLGSRVGIHVVGIHSGMEFRWTHHSSRLCPEVFPLLPRFLDFRDAPLLLVSDSLAQHGIAHPPGNYRERSPLKHLNSLGGHTLQKHD